MTNTIKSLLLFSTTFFVVLFLVFTIHTELLKYYGFDPNDYAIIPAYWVNYALAVVIFAVIFILRKKYSHLLGFIFMGGSLLKFAVFFIFFNPVYKEDNIVEPVESTSFLVPYLVCLFLETFTLIRVLNKED